MCGIAGFIGNGDIDDIVRMTRNLKHRGPDEEGFWKNDIKHIFFGHRRLSVIDPVDGKQPMWDNTSSLCIIFNGEIYNYIELRKELESLGYVFQTSHSDTEVLLIAYKEWGEHLVSRLNGMWAFAIYDVKKEEIFISRDRVGEKPLFYTFQNGTFAFASELKSLIQHVNISTSVSKLSLQKYFAYGFIPAPKSLYANIFKLPGGYNLFVNVKSLDFKICKYWSFCIEPVDKVPKNAESVWGEELRDLLNKAVQCRMRSDVPLGVFLSGGIDSSIVTSILSKNLSNIRTYTIGFEDKDYDESIYAKKIAKYLGTIHTEHIFSKNDIIDLIPRLSETFTEPFADSSQIPTMLLSNITSKNATVALSGDGGDELFCGYNRYIYAKKYWKYISRLPIGLKKSFLFIMNNCPNIFIKFLFSFIFEDDNFSIDNKINKILIKLSHIKNKETFYESMITEWSSTDKITNIENNSFVDNENYNIFSNKEIQLTDCMMFIDFHTYLTDDILCKVDRSSMNYSLEVRAPFLNSKLIELAFDMPLDYKIFQNNSKFILKDILSEYIPKQYFLRPKKGFSIPVSDWIKNDLKDWVNETLSYSMNSKHNLFNQKVIEKTKKEHFEGHFNHEHKLWSLIQFNSWYDKFLN